MTVNRPAARAHAHDRRSSARHLMLALVLATAPAVGGCVSLGHPLAGFPRQAQPAESQAKAQAQAEKQARAEARAKAKAEAKARAEAEKQARDQARAQAKTEVQGKRKPKDQDAGRKVAKDESRSKSEDKPRGKKKDRNQDRDRNEDKEPRTLDEVRARAAREPSQPFWSYRLGQMYLAADSAGQAEVALKASLASDPGYAPALALMSKLYFLAGRHEEAVQMLEAARSGGFPGGFPPALLAGLALHYDALDRTDLAADLMARAGRAQANGSPSVYMTLRSASPDSAAEPAEDAVKKAPRSAVNQNNYGITRLRAGDLDGAQRAFATAIEIDPSLPGPYYNLAILEKYYRFDDDAAAKWFRLYGARSQDDPDGLADVFGKGEAKQLTERSP
jgi:tetratricopeptide (TPR) repeat protein